MQRSDATTWPRGPYRMSGREQANAHTTTRIRALAWPVADLDEALLQMAQQLGFLTNQEGLRLPPGLTGAAGTTTLDRWLDIAVGQMGLEIETVSTTYATVTQLLCDGAPALLPIYVNEQQLYDLQTTESPNFLVLLKGNRWRVTLLGADGRLHHYATASVCAAICAVAELPLQPMIHAMLDEMAIPAERRHKAYRGLLQEELQQLEIPGFRLVRLMPGNGFWPQVRRAGLTNFLWSSLAAQATSYIGLLICLDLVKRAIGEGNIVWAVLTAGLLTLLTAIPFFALASWLGFVFNYGAAVLIKQRLFDGVLHLDLDELQRQGIGQFLSWLIESETLQEVGLTRAVAVALAVVPLLVINLVLFISGDILIGCFMLGWFGVTVWWGYRLCLRYITLNTHHTEMITGLLERIRGHQTRLVQEDKWHEADDRDVADYLALSQHYDHENLRIWVLVPYGWIALMLLGIATDFVLTPGLESSTTVGLRFLSFVFGTFQFQFLALVIPDIARAYAAWRIIAPIQQAATTHAAAQQLRAGNGDELDVHPEDLVLSADVPLLEGRGLTFRYRAGGRAILADCQLAIYNGDRLLLEGPSGGGKSTLASLLIGLHAPETGLLLLRGLDRHTVNEQVWRQRVVAAPQFHENHVLNASLAFNLLMGRRWPAWPADLVEAATVCRELGLGPLLDRMPLGLDQPVGEQGWRLSQGERSRLFIARALLQNADLVILDESFASLDPENMQIAMECVRKRAATLLVIAHP